MKERFIEHKFQKASLKLIETANEILEEYSQQSLVLTLRQLYYQFVARGLLPNKQTEYSRLGAIISDARLAGLVDWAMMEDRTRYVRSSNAWNDPASIVEAVAYQYKEDLWADQKYRPEIWIEKDALVGVIEKACKDLRVSYFACRGYASQSAQYETGQRFKEYFKRKQTPIIFHFGDHDPSGIDMSRDNIERVSMFSSRKVEVKRLALNMDQIEKYNPPPNPAKESDSRAEKYIELYGAESWELDALEPTVIDLLIRDNVSKLIDDGKWKKALEKETENRKTLQAVSDRWNDVQDYLNEE